MLRNALRAQAIAKAFPDKPQPPEKDNTPDILRAIDRIVKAIESTKEEETPEIDIRAELKAIAKTIQMAAGARAQEPIDYSGLIERLIQAVNAAAEATRDNTKALLTPKTVELSEDGTKGTITRG